MNANISERHLDDLQAIGSVLALYAFDAAGSEITDRSGNGRHGRWEPAVEADTAPLAGTAGSVRLDGSQIGTVDDHDSFDGDAVSFLGWFRIADDEQQHILWGRDAKGNFEGDANLRTEIGGTLRTAHQAEGGGHGNLDVPGIVPGRWYQAVQTFGPGGYELWLDGRHWGTRIEVKSGMSRNRNPINWGFLPWGSVRARCSLGPWAMYGKVLSDAEIISLCPHVGAPALAAGSIALAEGATAVLALDDLAPRYLGRRRDLRLTFSGVPAGLTVSQTTEGDIRVAAAAGSAGAQSFGVSIADAKAASAGVPIAVTVTATGAAAGDLDDAYGQIAAQTVGDVIFALRLGEREGASSAADASGNGWAAAYAPGGTGGLAGIAFASPKSAYRTNGAGHVTRAHKEPLAPAAGALAAWFRVPDLANQATVAQKGRDCQITVETDGRIRLSWRGEVIQTPPGYAEANVRNHAMVAFDGTDVRFYVDGFLVGGRNDGQGLTGNSADWVFGRSVAGATSAITLHEIYLFGGAQKSFAHAVALAEGQRGLAYRAPLNSVKVSDVRELNDATKAASPGDHIILADGTYQRPRDVAGSGTNRNQIVIRAANPGKVTIEGGWKIKGDWIVVDGLDFAKDDEPISLAGNRSRLTRCRRDRFTGDACRVDGGRFNRIDHCAFTMPNLDSNGKTAGNAPIEVNPHLGTRFLLIDHFYTTAPKVKLGNGRDGIRFGSTGGHTKQSSFSTVYRSFFDDYDADEIVSGKSADIFIWYSVFKDGLYTQDRHSFRHEWRSCAWDNCEHRVCGKDHTFVGCSFDRKDLRILAGKCLQADFPSGGIRPAAENTGIIECRFESGSTAIIGDEIGGNVKARGTFARGNRGLGSTINAPSHIEPSVKNLDSQGDWREDPPKLDQAAVGRAGADPLVPPGLS